MAMSNPSCELLIAELEGALRARSFERLPLSVPAHISACPRCRAGLTLLVSACADAVPDPGDCDRCQADLAAFMEQEHTDAAGAAAAYGHVWRHLWSCLVCLEDYLVAGEWLEAEQAGLLAPLKLSTRTPIERAIGAIRRIVLTRSVLTLAIPPPQIALAPQRGVGGDGFVLFEDNEGSPQAHLTVLVRDSGDGTWELIVRTSPPVVGLLRVAAGDTRLTAPFLGDGSATISAIPFALLADQQAPDMELIVLPVQSAAEL